MAWKINAGARRGMVGLGVVSDNVSEEQFQYYFQAVYQAVCSLLSPAEQGNIGWDHFVLEHALCKGKRLRLF